MAAALVFLVTLSVSFQEGRIADIFTYDPEENRAYAHFFNITGVTIKDFGIYRVVFLPTPTTPVTGDDSTRLNFGVIDNNSYTTGVAAALKIRREGSEADEAQIAYKLYEFGDITYPYNFQKPGDYVVTLQAIISGDPDYGKQPLLANFDVRVIEPPAKSLSLGQIMLFIAVPVAVVLVGSLIYLDRRRKVRKV